MIVCLHGFTIIVQTSINKCTNKKKKRTKIGCCLSFAYAETRLGELWRQSSRGELWRERRDCESSRARLKNPWDLRKGKGESDGVSGRGDRVSLFFSLFIKLVNSVRFYRVDRVWPSLVEFDHFRVFNSILHVICELTRKIVWFYESTRDFDNNGWRVRLQFLSEK